MSAKFPSQVRFNWGFHDGSLDAEMGKPYLYSHFDKPYLRGWQLGFAEYSNTGKRPDSSLEFWLHGNKALSPAFESRPGTIG